MSSPIVEDYLKSILLEQEGLPRQGQVPMSAVARALGVTPGTATAMIQGLAEAGLLIYKKRGGCRLSETGELEALQILRRHRLIETFLVSSLGLDWAEVHDEADRLEHALSEGVAERLDEFLGFPTRDPHGDPIPNAVGWLDHQSWARLVEAPLASPLRLVRLLDQSPDFLRFARTHGLLIDSPLQLIDSGAVSGATLVKTELEEGLALGFETASRILVEVLSG